MKLIDIDRLRCQSIRPVLYELIVVPDVIIGIVYDRRIVGTRLEMSCERIALLINPVISADNSVLIAVPLSCFGHLLLPNTGLAEHKHLAAVGIPVVEVAHNADHSCIRSPHAEYKALPVLVLIRMSTEELVAHIILAFVE